MAGTKHRRVVVTLLALLLAALDSMSSATAQGARFATVTVLHGLPNFTADVYVNGDLLLDGFKPETATDPLELPPGNYDLAIRNVGSPPDSEPALAGSITLHEGQNLSIIAGVDLDGSPKLNVFANDLSPVPAGQARVVLRNVADAPPADLLVGGDVVLRDVANGGEATKVVRSGNRDVEITRDGGGDPLIGSTSTSLAEGTSVILYLVGSDDQDNLDLMVQAVSGLHSDPSSVDSGDGGLAGSSGRWPPWATTLVALSAGMAIWSARQLLRKPAR